MIRLAHYFNKTILACIPSLFEDQRPRRFKLVGIEESGLWLEGEEFAGVLQTEEQAIYPPGAAAAFFPYAQIAYLTPDVYPYAAGSVAPPCPPSQTTGGQTPERPGKAEKKHSGSEPKRKK
jgi:hypothetical protein